MKCEINAEGNLTLISETEMEKFVLLSWKRRHRVNVKYIHFDLERTDYNTSFIEFTKLIDKEHKAFREFRKSRESPVKITRDSEVSTISIQETAPHRER